MAGSERLTPSGARRRADYWWAAAILLLVALVARAQTFGNPVLGFDEQFYALVGERMLHGAIPYVDIFDRKPVGLFLVYAGAAALGPDVLLQYKLLALAAVVATALIVFAIARRSSALLPALAAAALSILWLDFMEGEGGQSPIFYDLPMAAAAWLVLRVGVGEASPRRTGTLAMALVGIALQIKYSVLFEGIFFGCWLIASAWMRGERGGALIVSILCWVGAALLPTALACAAYVAIGQGPAFLFANFLSVMAQGRGSGGLQYAGLGVIVGILALPLLLVASGWRGRTRAPGDAFLLGWLLAALFGMIVYWRFASPHYAIPVIVPLACLVARVTDRGAGWRIATALLLVIGLVGGQIVLALTERTKGGASAAAAVARAADPRGRGCIYVYDGYPALYLLTKSCLPTRWVFPGHLNTAEEANPAALGTDPDAEIARILSTRPIAIVDDYPRFSEGNPSTRRILQRTLDSGYRLAACVPTGKTRVRLIYRRDLPPATPRPATCPSVAALAIR